MPSIPRRLAFAFTLGLILLAAIPASGEPIIVKPGPVVLPITGLAFDLPTSPRGGFSWSLSSSFSLSDNGAAFDGRDIIDEKLNGKIIAGIWVQMGYFNAGACKAVVAEPVLTDAWGEERELYGCQWCLRGGLYELGDFGKVPAVVMCAHREGRKDLLIYRFFVDLPLKSLRADLIAALEKTAVLERIARAWKQDAYAAVKPLRRPEVRDRGTVKPVRTVTLAKSGLTLTLPDDGLIWLVRAPAEKDTVDWLEVMAPAMHEVIIEVVRLPGAACQDVFDGITAEKRYDAPPANVPAGWTIGPTLMNDGDLERVVCRVIGGDAILVGLFTKPDKGRGAGDFTELAPMLDVIAAAAAPR